MKIETIIRLTKNRLFEKLCVPNSIFRKDGYVLIPGELPVMLVAHLDTVHKEPVRVICYNKSKNVLMSPQGIGGDDRCGVYALLEIYNRSKRKPWLLFTCDEEVGGKGARMFCDDHTDEKLPKELDKLKFIIEIDRKGNDDAVYYDCANDDFEDYITSKGFQSEWGTFSDISLIAPELGVAAVNLSSGYYNAHTQHEYIVMSDLRYTINRVMSILEDVDDLPQYPYICAPYVYNGTALGGSQYDWYGDYSGMDDYWYKGAYHSKGSKKGLVNYTTDAKKQREYLLDLGYTQKELDELTEMYGKWAVEETYWEEYARECR